MNWEAFWIIGLSSVVLGLLLFIPAWLWMRRQQQLLPEYKRNTLTKTGWVFACLLVTFLIAGAIMQYVAPHSGFGEFVSTGAGRLIFYTSVGVVFWSVEIALKARGINLTREIDVSSEPKKRRMQ